MGPNEIGPNEMGPNEMGPNEIATLETIYCFKRTAINSV